MFCLRDKEAALKNSKKETKFQEGGIDVQKGDNLAAWVPKFHGFQRKGLTLNVPRVS